MSSVEDTPPASAPPAKPAPRLSAKAAHPDGRTMTEAEIEAAEEEALAWARRANSCCSG